MPNPQGFSEASVAALGQKDPVLQAHASFGKDGRVLIPIALREAAGIKPGERVVIRVQDGALVIETLDARIARIQAIFAPYKREGESIVDEFIAEKRAEAARE